MYAHIQIFYNAKKPSQIFWKGEGVRILEFEAWAHGNMHVNARMFGNNGANLVPCGSHGSALLSSFLRFKVHWSLF